MNKFIFILEVISIILSIIFGWLWIKNPSGPYEPLFALSGLGIVITEFCRRHKKKTSIDSSNKTFSKPNENGIFKIIKKLDAFRPHAFWGDGRVDPIAHFTIDFDFINNKDEVTVLNRPEITKIKTNSELFNNKPAGIHFKHYPGRIDSWIFPFKFQGKSRLMMRCEIDILITNNDLTHFAQNLDSLTTYEIEFQFSHEDMTASKTVENVNIIGTYDDFKEEVLNFWEGKGININIHNKPNSGDAKRRATN